MSSDPQTAPFETASGSVYLPQRWPVNRKKGDDLRLGEWLVKRALISRVELFFGLSLAYTRGCRIGDALVRLGTLRRDVVEREVWRLTYMNRARDRRADPAPAPSSHQETVPTASVIARTPTAPGVGPRGDRPRGPQPRIIPS